MSNSYKVVSVQLDLERNTANVSFGKNNILGEVKVTVKDFNPPGEQGETELRKTAVESAKAILRDVISQDPQ